MRSTRLSLTGVVIPTQVVPNTAVFIWAFPMDLPHQTYDALVFGDMGLNLPRAPLIVAGLGDMQLTACRTDGKSFLFRTAAHRFILLFLPEPAGLPVPRCSVPGTFSPSHAESGFPPDVPAPHPQTAARHLDSQHRLQPFLHHMVFSHDRTSRLLSGISLMIRLYPVQYQVPETKSILFHNGYGAALTGQVFFHRLALHFLAVPPHGLIPVLLQC